MYYDTLQIKIVGYKPVTYYMPCAIIPSSVKTHVSRAEGFTTKTLCMAIVCPVETKYTIYSVDNASVNSDAGEDNAGDDNAGDGSDDKDRRTVNSHYHQTWDQCTYGDAGSRPWTMANALTTPENPMDVYNEGSIGSSSSSILPIDDDSNPFVVYSNTSTQKPDVGDTAPYDNSDGILSRKNPIEDEILPEDRFHSKDAGSQFHINQREQAIVDKREKHEQ